MSADRKLGTIDHLDWTGGWLNVAVMAGQYFDGTLALVLVCEDDEPLVVASTNLSPYELTPSSWCRVFIRSDAEREGLAEALRRKGVLTEYNRPVTFGPFDTAAEEVELAEPWRVGLEEN